MATTHLKGEAIRTVGELPAVGQRAPAIELVGADLAPLGPDVLRGGPLILNVFPSVDTRTCALSVRRFHEAAAGLGGARVVCASMDLPFAQARFCGAEGIADVVMGSAFRTSFGTDFGVTLAEGPMEGLLARAVLVLDAEGAVVHAQLVEEISDEPDYGAALAAVSALS